MPHRAATDELIFESDILEIAKKLGIPGMEDGKADAEMPVRHWPSNASEDRRLFILDNADDEEI